MRCGLYGPLKQKIGSGTPDFIVFIDDDFHRFHGLDVDGSIKIRSDGITVGIKIFRFADVDGILQVGVPHADGSGKVMGAVLRFTIDLGVYGKVGGTLGQGIACRKACRSMAPIYRIKGTYLLFLFDTGEYQYDCYNQRDLFQHRVPNRTKIHISRLYFLKYVRPQN